MPRPVTYRILKDGPAAVAVGRIAPTGRTAPKAPADITCPHFCDFKSINEVVFDVIKI